MTQSYFTTEPFFNLDFIAEEIATNEDLASHCQQQIQNMDLDGCFVPQLFEQNTDFSYLDALREQEQDFFATEWLSLWDQLPTFPATCQTTSTMSEQTLVEEGLSSINDDELSIAQELDFAVQKMKTKKTSSALKRKASSSLEHEAAMPQAPRKPHNKRTGKQEAKNKQRNQLSNENSDMPQTPANPSQQVSVSISSTNENNMQYCYSLATKKDTGYKPILRGIRGATKDSFDSFVQSNKHRFSQNRYRWTEEEFETILRAYLATLSSPILNNPSDKTVWIVGLLVYPNKESTCEPLNQALDQNDIALFKGIFGENNATSIAEFFGNEIIEGIWEDISKFFTMEQCFSKGPNPKYFTSYREVGLEIIQTFGLAMPSWFKQLFRI